ncbi:tripartite tricarboxylate transporter substrate binding protein [Curvibacter sp. HBC28]|uniref:Tripartite tricarboxylate transporter substrate binding protein n=1 Tax=Curvibacter microcysteis TaxID=3026419 RepID=A0ABT5M9S7_9BURK|nr:tripartite tricarboxylate transporter substrate binding protein [Curvibacter sp. HBC28]MDD0813186.1 tripartite tricarboxylate transporter substrate binding protein [Curvibacter sp. HBC28]
MLKAFRPKHPANALRFGAWALLTAAIFSSAHAQTYPAKPVRSVAPYSPGSGPDAVMRILSDRLSRTWGQQLVIDNKPGANGFIAISDAKRAAPDGYTVLQVDNTHMALQPHVFKQLPYDPAKDFEPVAPVYLTHFFVVVAANSPWKDVSDLVKAAKAAPGEITYGSWGIGSVAHVGAAMLEAATETRMMHVPFKDMGQVYTSVASGDIKWAFGTAATAGPMFQAKKVKFLALAAPKRLAGFTEVPTVGEAGGPAGFEVKTWVGMFAPTGTPKAAIDKINADVGKVLSTPEVKERLATFGFEPYIGPPSELTKAIERDSRTFGDVVKRAKISLD